MPTDTSPVAGNDRNIRILIVDDHADTSKVMQLLFERRGYQVTTAGSVSSAVTAAGAGEFDLLISDIGLPDGSGLDVIRLLREHGPVCGIAMSGFGMEDDIQKSLDAGFVEHLVKPVSFKKLHEVVERLTAHLKKRVGEGEHPEEIAE